MPQTMSSLYEVIDLCLPRFELTAIVSLSCSSKHSSSICHTLSRHRLQCLMPKAVAQAAVKGLPEAVLQKRIRLVKWLLKTAGRAPAPGSLSIVSGLRADALMHIPNVPAAVAGALVGAGMSVQYKHLLEAARNRVAGCEVWVQPYKRSWSFLFTQLPSWTLQICCNEPLVPLASVELLPATLPDVLQLSFNNQQPEAAESLLGLLVSMRDNPTRFQQCMQQLAAPLVDHLLHTAVLRQHTDVITAFDGLVETAAPGTISAAAVASYLSAAVEKQQNAMVLTLSQMQAAQRLEPAAVAAALQTAMQHEYHAAVPYLTKLPALRQLDAASMCTLLHTAVVHSYSDLVGYLCEQQAALHIEPGAAVIELLSTAIQHDETDSLQHLVQLQPAWQLDAHQVATLLETAVHAQSSSALELLCDELPAALEIAANRAAELLHTAIRFLGRGSSESEQILQDLCWLLPATQQIAPAAMQPLLAAAVKRKHIVAVKALCVLPGAKQLSFCSFWGLVWQAFDNRTLHQVMPHLPVHHHVLPHKAAADALQDSCYIGTVLDRAAKQGYHEAIEAMGKLDAAKSIPTSHVARWLGEALVPAASNGKGKPSHSGATGGRDEHHKVMAALCKLELAQPLSAHSLTHLMELALKQRDHKALEMLAGAKSAYKVKIDACSAAGMLWYAMQRGVFEAFVILCGRLNPARCIGSASIARMLPFVEQFGKEDQEKARNLLLGVAAQPAAAQQPVPAAADA